MKEGDCIYLSNKNINMVVRKGKNNWFEFNYKDKSTWSEVLAYGRSLGLPIKGL